MVTELSQYPRWACNGFRSPRKRDRQADKWLVIAMKPYLSEGKGSSLLSLSINESEGVLMLPAQVIRRLEALGEISKQGKRLNGLFRLMESPILWYEAYANIYSNEGAMTKGVDSTTLDGFSKERVESIVQRLREGRYRFKPTRRVYVPKKNGKKRPLGISSGDDKLVQEVVRSILEQIYEPIFEDRSHGFRPGRSPHTALHQIEREWTAAKWIIDMDIRDYFTTIDHDLLMSFLAKKIEDKRFLRLIRAMLDAGYLEEWTYHTTYSGVPQGSIVSPVLANVYLHELDLFMKTMKEQFDKGIRRKGNRAYKRHSNKIHRLRKKGDRLKGKENCKETLQAIQREIKEIQRQRRRLPSSDPFDEGYKRLSYCRYADDYVISMIGSKADAERIQQEVKRFIQETLKLEVAEDKSHIRHSKQGVIFVGYWIKTYSGARVVKVQCNARHTTRKSMSERIQLQIPQGKLQKFCAEKRYGIYENVKGRHKAELSTLSDAEIILAYNGELRGLAKYYALAHSVKGEMNKLAHIWQTSLFKTLAHKHKTHVTTIAKHLKTDEGYVHTVQEKGKTRTIRLFRLKDLKTSPSPYQSIDIPPNTFALTLSCSELIRRINAEQCEYCETKEGLFQVHHIRKMKDVANGKELWQRIMMARRRKTLILCVRCHQQLHAGTLPGRSQLKR
ncbi:maturase [Ktedonospora formicarum]|uniref:Maturase n=2 Tax=Ktedonospora formicarum TaxID=2778364 RepID=A0A8J3I5E9_9CHLR|nr:maturase [Ktedonospora formicarum]